MTIQSLAYLDGKSVTASKTNKFFYDGKKIDLLIILSDLRSQLEVEELIHFLKVHKHCFEKLKQLKP